LSKTNLLLCYTGSQCNTFDTKADAVQPHDMNTAHQSEASPAADDIACQSGEAKTADVAHSEYQFQEPLDEEARTKGGSDVVSSDYRFAYLGCKVWDAALFTGQHCTVTLQSCQ